MSFVVTIFDTETTGLFSSALIDDDRKPEMIEFFAIKLEIDSGTRIKEYEFLCRPKRAITEETTKITGIKQSMVEEEKPFAHYIPVIREALEETDAVIAHNASYDKEMVETEMNRCGMKLKWPRIICTVEQTACIRGYRLTLTELHKELMGVPFEGAHRARQDVEALTSCVLKLYERGFI